MPSTGVKFFSSILAYGLVPLLIAAQSNKVSYLVVLDLTVWLIAVAALVYLVKTPWELWILSKGKTKDLEDRKKAGENVQAEMAEVRQLEQKMYYIAMATPFMATGGWHFLAQFVARYGLNAMTEIVHPYFILIVGIMAGLYPVHKYYTKMKFDLKHSAQPQISAEIHQMYNAMKQKHDILEKLQRQIEAEVVKNESNRMKIEREVRALRKEIQQNSDKQEDMQSFEKRVGAIETQVELSQMMLRDVANQKGLIDTLVSTPMKLIYNTKK